MNHAQAVFLAHGLSSCIAFQLICEYRHWKNKKARQRANADRAEKKSLKSSISQLSRKNNRSR